MSSLVLIISMLKYQYHNKNSTNSIGAINTVTLQYMGTEIREFILNDDVTTTNKYNKQCTYFMGYTPSRGQNALTITVMVLKYFSPDSYLITICVSLLYSLYQTLTSYVLHTLQKKKHRHFHSKTSCYDAIFFIISSTSGWHYDNLRY